MGSKLEVDASPKRLKGFDLSGVKGKRADQDAEAGFDALSRTVAKIGSITDNRASNPLNKLRSQGRFVMMGRREAPPLEETMLVDQGVELEP